MQTVAAIYYSSNKGRAGTVGNKPEEISRHLEAVVVVRLWQPCCLAPFSLSVAFLLYLTAKLSYLIVNNCSFRFEHIFERVEWKLFENMKYHFWNERVWKRRGIKFLWLIFFSFLFFFLEFMQAELNNWPGKIFIVRLAFFSLDWKVKIKVKRGSQGFTGHRILREERVMRVCVSKCGRLCAGSR